MQCNLLMPGAEEETPEEDTGDGWVKQKKGNKKALTQETGAKVTPPPILSRPGMFPPPSLATSLQCNYTIAT